MSRRAESRFALVCLLWAAAVVACGAAAGSASAEPPAVAANGIATVPEDAAAEDAVGEWLAETTGQTASGSPVIRRQRADRQSSRAGLPAGAGSNAWETWRMAWPLAVILGVIGLITYALRRWMPRSAGLGGSGLITVLARHHLSPKQSLCLIRIGRRVLLIGVTPDAIRAVTEFNRDDEAAALIAAAERGKPGSFSTMFSRLTERDLEHQLGVTETGAATPSSDGALASVGPDVRGLVQRVRTLASRSDMSVEPT